MLTLIVKAVEKPAKRAEIIAYTLVLITKRNAKLKVANRVATQCKSHKRKRMQKRGTLIISKEL